MTDHELIELAKKALENSYSPYSKFKVGAALLCKDGTVFSGCNVENASFGATNCAERTAIFSAVANGHRDFSKIAIVGTSDGNINQFTSLCGMCRQVLSEFCGEDFNIILFNGKNIKTFTMNEILPYPFSDF